MFKMSFNTGSDAFYDHHEDPFNAIAKAEEAARILRYIAEEIELGIRSEGAVMDYNGNKVGEWSLD